MDNKFIDTCRLFGNYDGQNVYNSAKYEAPRMFYTPNTIIYQNGQMLKN